MYMPQYNLSDTKFALGLFDIGLQNKLINSRTSSLTSFFFLFVYYYYYYYYYYLLFLLINYIYALPAIIHIHLQYFLFYLHTHKHMHTRTHTKKRLLYSYTLLKEIGLCQPLQGFSFRHSERNCILRGKRDCTHKENSIRYLK